MHLHIFSNAHNLSISIAAKVAILFPLKNTSAWIFDIVFLGLNSTTCVSNTFKKFIVLLELFC